jgi:hypothetical protein
MDNRLLLTCNLAGQFFGAMFENAPNQVVASVFLRRETG